MEIFFALLIYVNGELQPDRTVYYNNIDDCMYAARLLNTNTSVGAPRVSAQCLPQRRRP